MARGSRNGVYADWSDVEAHRVKAKAGQIAGNFNTLIMLRVKEVATAELMTSQLPGSAWYRPSFRRRFLDTNDPGDFADLPATRIGSNTESAQMLAQRSGPAAEGRPLR